MVILRKYVLKKCAISSCAIDKDSEVLKLSNNASHALLALQYSHLSIFCSVIQMSQIC